MDNKKRFIKVNKVEFDKFIKEFKKRNDIKLSQLLHIVCLWSDGINFAYSDNYGFYIREDFYKKEVLKK